MRKCMDFVVIRFQICIFDTLNTARVDKLNRKLVL